mmetsp:Transcript_14769/g.27833  ORF Transcript_14769/g.27833 Transcript_14769/m.27833 type:complete len:117 (-) Transcript_14769:191-541(-)
MADQRSQACIDMILMVERTAGKVSGHQIRKGGRKEGKGSVRSAGNYMKKLKGATLLTPLASTVLIHAIGRGRMAPQRIRYRVRRSISAKSMVWNGLASMLAFELDNLLLPRWTSEV